MKIIGRRFFSFSLVLLVCALTGCATPSVDYTLIKRTSNNKQLPNHTDTFALQESELVIKSKVLKDGESDALEITLEKLEHPESVVGISSKKVPGVTTMITIVKEDNTNLVQTISSDVDDHRIKFIESAGKVLATGLGVAIKASGAKDPDEREPDEDSVSFADLPLYLKLQPSIEKLYPLSENSSVNRTSEIVLRQGVTLKVGDVPADARLLDRLDVSSLSSMFFYSACRPATVTVKFRGETLVQRVKLADPRYVQLVAFPTKGTLTSHSQCGMSVASQKANISSDLDVLDAFLSQVADKWDQLAKVKKGE